jgi:anti-anti-sigma factor
VSGSPRIQVDRDQGIPVVHVAGEMEISQAPVIRELLVGAADNRDVGVVIDLGDTTYLDSAGVNILFELADGLAKRQLRMALVVPEGGLVDRVVTLVDLASVAPVHRSLESALGQVADVRR